VPPGRRHARPGGEGPRDGRAGGHQDPLGAARLDELQQHQSQGGRGLDPEGRDDPSRGQGIRRRRHPRRPLPRRRRHAPALGVRLRVRPQDREGHPGRRRRQREVRGLHPGPEPRDRELPRRVEETHSRLRGDGGEDRLRERVEQPVGQARPLRRLHTLGGQPVGRRLLRRGQPRQVRAARAVDRRARQEAAQGAHQGLQAQARRPRRQLGEDPRGQRRLASGPQGARRRRLQRLAHQRKRRPEPRGTQQAA